jgi:hypothetical protein
LRGGEVALAATDPAQRRTRIASDGILDQPLEGRRQARLVRHRSLRRLDGISQVSEQLWLVA